MEIVMQEVTLKTQTLQQSTGNIVDSCPISGQIYSVASKKGYEKYVVLSHKSTAYLSLYSEAIVVDFKEAWPDEFLFEAELLNQAVPVHMGKVLQIIRLEDPGVIPDALMCLQYYLYSKNASDYKPHTEIDSLDNVLEIYPEQEEVYRRLDLYSKMIDGKFHVFFRVYPEKANYLEGYAIYHTPQPDAIDCPSTEACFTVVWLKSMPKVVVHTAVNQLINARFASMLVSA